MNNQSTILVVDDDPGILDLVTDFLRDIFPDAQILTAPDIRGAQVKIQAQKFNLIICDVNLGRANGASLVQLAASLPAEMRPEQFILISGGSDPNLAPTRLGKIHFLSKPFSQEVFTKLVRSLAGPSGGSTAAAPVPFKIDVNFINPFIESTLAVLETTAGVKARKEKLFLRADDTAQGDISAVIAMNSDTYLGSMAVSFENTCFLHIVNSMLGEKYTTISSENEDGAAEICNQIFGRSKKLLNEQGHKIHPALPTLVIGHHHRIKHSAIGPCIVVQFATSAGLFTIEAIIQNR